MHLSAFCDKNECGEKETRMILADVQEVVIDPVGGNKFIVANLIDSKKSGAFGQEPDR